MLRFLLKNRGTPAIISVTERTRQKEEERKTMKTAVLVGSVKTVLLVLGIAGLILGVLSLLFAAFWRFSYYHTMDGSPELYLALRRRMVLFFVVGIALAAAGGLCLLLRLLL